MALQRIAMEDGGDVEYDSRDPIVPIGNRLGVPEKFRFVHPGGEKQPSYRIEFGVMNKIPVCLGIHVEAKDGVPVRTADLKHLHIDKLVISAVGAAAYEEMPAPTGRRRWRKPHGDRDFNAANIEAGQRIVKGKPRTRRSPDDVDLQLVADTWRNAADGARTEALMTVFFCSKATAARYKKRAVEEGLLDG